jgi:Cu+-exporting ATPase
MVARGGRTIGVIGVADEPRESAAAVVEMLREQGVEHVVLLTGDHERAARAVAANAGISEYRASLLPEDKVAAVEDLRRRYGVLAMVGDGVNDAPALARADVSFALAAGSGAALDVADVTLMKNDLAGIADAIMLSRATLAKIRQNLFFAFLYNALGIPLAAAGMLNPMIAGAAMALSSVSVVGNSLWLNRWKPSS